MGSRGYSDRINHVLSYVAKHRPAPADRAGKSTGVVRTTNVAIILTRYGADDLTLMASALRHLIEETEPAERERLLKVLPGKFGQATVRLVMDSLTHETDTTGRPRAWRAMRLEQLERLAQAEPRAVDITVADEIHHCGCLLAHVRRLGTEYLDTITAASPAEILWWHKQLMETLPSHARWRRPEMLEELRELSLEFAQLL